MQVEERYIFLLLRSSHKTQIMSIVPSNRPENLIHCYMVYIIHNQYLFHHVCTTHMCFHQQAIILPCMIHVYPPPTSVFHHPAFVPPCMHHPQVFFITQLLFHHVYTTQKCFSPHSSYSTMYVYTTNMCFHPPALIPPCMRHPHVFSPPIA